MWSLLVPVARKPERTLRRQLQNFGKTGVNFEVAKLNAASKETVKKYGVLVPPAVAVNGVVRIMGAGSRDG